MCRKLTARNPAAARLPRHRRPGLRPGGPAGLPPGGSGVRGRRAAAAAIDAKGKAVFPDFRETGGAWWIGPTYLVVVDLTGKTLVNAAFPKFEGTDATVVKDVTGKHFVTAFIDKAKASGSGWVDYMWPKPGETQPSQKWTYVKAVTVDGVPALVGAGFYP